MINRNEQEVVSDREELHTDQLQDWYNRNGRRRRWINMDLGQRLILRI